MCGFGGPVPLLQIIKPLLMHHARCNRSSGQEQSLLRTVRSRFPVGDTDTSFSSMLFRRQAESSAWGSLGFNKQWMRGARRVVCFPFNKKKNERDSEGKNISMFLPIFQLVSTWSFLSQSWMRKRSCGYTEWPSQVWFWTPGSGVWGGGKQGSGKLAVKQFRSD